MIGMDANGDSNSNRNKRKRRSYSATRGRGGLKEAITLQDKGKVSRAVCEAALWSLRTLMRCIDWDNVAEVKFVNSMVDGFANWNLETIDGCGMKWISKEAKRFLLEKHGVDPRLIVENFDIGRTFDKHYPKDMELRNCLSNNLAGYEKKLVREHLVPKSEMKKHLADWSVPVSEIVENEFDLALITAEEDERLKDSEYRDKRPGGWRRCYRECGIELERLPGKALSA